MLELHRTKRFEKDYSLMIKRGYDIAMLQKVVLTLQIPEKLPAKNKDHNLAGNLAGFRECHITNDWLLMYKQNESAQESEKVILFFCCHTASSQHFSQHKSTVGHSYF